MPRAFGPSRLLVSEDEEEADGVDTEEILTKLAGVGRCGYMYSSVCTYMLYYLHLA